MSHGIRAEVKLVVKDGVLQTEVEKTGFFSRGLKDVRLYVTSPRVETTAERSITGALSGGSMVQAGKKPERVQYE